MKHLRQSRWQSALEVAANIAIGFGVALVSQIVIFHFYKIVIPLSKNVEITLWFTFISIIRSYVLRRLFDRWHATQLFRRLQGKHA